MRGETRPKSFPIGRTGERTCAGPASKNGCSARVQQEATHLRQAAFGHCCFQRGGKAQRIPAQRGNTWDTWYTGLTRSPPSQAYSSTRRCPRARDAAGCRPLGSPSPMIRQKQARRAQQSCARQSDRSGPGSTTRRSTSDPQAYDRPQTPVHRQDKSAAQPVYCYADKRAQRATGRA